MEEKTKGSPTVNLAEGQILDDGRWNSADKEKKSETIRLIWLKLSCWRNLNTVRSQE